MPIDELKPLTDYYIKVKAVNDAGEGPLSEVVQFTTPNGGVIEEELRFFSSLKIPLGPENPPINVRIEINEANTPVLTWTPPNTTTELTVSKGS